MAKKLEIDFPIPLYLENSINILYEKSNKTKTLASEKDTVSKDIGTAEATGKITAVQSNLLLDYYISGERFGDIELPWEVQEDIEQLIYLKYIMEKTGIK